MIQNQYHSSKSIESKRMKYAHHLLCLLLIPNALNAMQKENPNVGTVQCDIHKNDNPNSLITFSGAFVKYLLGTRNIRNTVTLQCSVTRNPTITVNPDTKLLTIQCAFKDVIMQQIIAVSEDISLESGTVTRALSHGWHMTVSTTVPSSYDADR
jgi:hypothetical protein